jgi:hypothetical protein
MQLAEVTCPDEGAIALIDNIQQGEATSRRTAAGSVGLFLVT